jgi:hypothetical protein
MENLIASNRREIGLTGVIRTMRTQPSEKPAPVLAQLGGGLVYREHI